VELRQQRRADNERVYRRVAGVLEGHVAIVCECRDATCTKHLDVARDEWQRVRAHDTWYFVRPGHEDVTRERVVEADERYLVVEVV
jgi:hypothetical protein